jgi:hypothetical protein
LRRKQIESSLLGAIFDPYVRWIVWEGIRQWWHSDLPSWLSCPPTGDPYPHSTNSPIPPSHPLLNQLRAYTSVALSYLPDSISSLINSALPIPLAEIENFNEKMLSLTPARLAGTSSPDDVDQTRIEGEMEDRITNMGGKQVGWSGEPFPACPYTWAKPLHEINCDLAWPAEYTGEHGAPLIELDTDSYVGRINREKTMEKLMAMAGLRLAKIVNEAVGGKEVAGVYFE